MPQQIHLEAYLDAMHSRDVAKTIPYMAENVTLRSPLLPEATIGKTAVAEVLKGLLENVDSFEMKQLIGSGSDFVAVFTITAGQHKVDGMDHMHLDESGLVDSMTVAWRPLSELVGIQQTLAAVLGFPALQLVPLK